VDASGGIVPKKKRLQRCRKHRKFSFLEAKIAPFKNLHGQKQIDQKQLRRSYGLMEVAPPLSPQSCPSSNTARPTLIWPTDSRPMPIEFPEKRQWHIKGRAPSESSRWAQLCKPFALTVIKGTQGQVKTMHYISRKMDKSRGEDLYYLFCEAGIRKKALEKSVRRQGEGRYCEIYVQFAIHKTFGGFVTNIFKVT